MSQKQTDSRAPGDGLTAETTGSDPGNTKVRTRDSSHEKQLNFKRLGGLPSTNKFLNRPLSSDRPIKRKSHAPGDRRPQRLNRPRGERQTPVRKFPSKACSHAVIAGSRKPPKHPNRVSPSVGPSVHPGPAEGMSCRLTPEGARARVCARPRCLSHPRSDQQSNRPTEREKPIKTRLSHSKSSQPALRLANAGQSCKSSDFEIRVFFFHFFPFIGVKKSVNMLSGLVVHIYLAWRI